MTVIKDIDGSKAPENDLEEEEDESTEKEEDEDDESESESDEVEEKESEEEVEGEESEEEEEEPEEGTEEESEEEKDPEVPPVKQEVKMYTFNGKQLTADELFEQSLLLNKGFTEASQEAARLRGENKDDSKKEVKKSKYTPEQLAEFKEFARESGLLLKEDVTKEQEENTQKSILEGFVKDHPEYKDAQNSAKLFAGLDAYNTTNKYLKSSLEKAHKDIFPDNASDKKDVTEAEVRAKQTKLNRSGAGVGKGAKKVINSTSHNTPEQIAVMKQMGVYDDEE